MIYSFLKYSPISSVEPLPESLEASETDLEIQSSRSEDTTFSARWGKRHLLLLGAMTFVLERSVSISHLFTSKALDEESQLRCHALHNNSLISPNTRVDETLSVYEQFLHRIGVFEALEHLSFEPVHVIFGCNKGLAQGIVDHQYILGFPKPLPLVRSINIVNPLMIRSTERVSNNTLISENLLNVENMVMNLQNDERIRLHGTLPFSITVSCSEEETFRLSINIDHLDVRLENAFVVSQDIVNIAIKAIFSILGLSIETITPHLRSEELAEGLVFLELSEQSTTLLSESIRDLLHRSCTLANEPNFTMQLEIEKSLPDSYSKTHATMAKA